MNSTHTTPAFDTDIFAKTSVPMSVRSTTIDLVIPIAGFAIGIALFTSCWKLGLWHSPLGIAFAGIFLLAMPIVALGRAVVEVCEGKAGTQGDFVLFATFGYLATFVIGLLTR